MLCVDVLCALARDHHTVADICGLPIEYYEDMPCRCVATLLKDHYHKFDVEYEPCDMRDIAGSFYSMHKQRGKG